MDRICSKCGGEFPDTDEFFSPHPTGKNGRLAKCRECKREYGRALYAKNPKKHIERSKTYYREHLEEKRAYTDEYRLRSGVVAYRREYSARRRHEKAEVLRDYKLARGCAVCGYDEHYEALDFHHRDPDTKEIPMYHWQNYPWAKVMAELEKCAVVCATCHRLLTAGLVELPGKFYGFAKITG